MNRFLDITGMVLTGFIGGMAFCWALAPDHPKESVAQLVAAPEKVYKGVCDEHRRVKSIQACLANYYHINPVSIANVPEDQEAFERCRASANYQFCKWRLE